MFSVSLLAEVALVLGDCARDSLLRLVSGVCVFQLACQLLAEIDAPSFSGKFPFFPAVPLVVEQSQALDALRCSIGGMALRDIKNHQLLDSVMYVG